MVFKARNIDVIYLYCFYLGERFANHREMLNFASKLFQQNFATALIDLKEELIVSREEQYFPLIAEVDADLFYEEYIDSGRFIRLKLKPFIIENFQDNLLKRLTEKEKIEVECYLFLHISGIALLTSRIKIRNKEIDFETLRKIISLDEELFLAKIWRNIILDLKLEGERVEEKEYWHLLEDGQISYLTLDAILSFYDAYIRYHFFSFKKYKIKDMDKLDEMTKYIYNLTYPILIIRGTKGLPKKEYLKTYAVELYSLLMGEYDLKLIRNIIPNLEELILDYDLSYEDDKALFIGWGNALIIVTSFFENYLKTHSESFEEDYMYYIWNDIAIFETLIFQNQLLHLIDYQINQLSTELSPSELARIRDEKEPA